MPRLVALLSLVVMVAPGLEGRVPTPPSRWAKDVLEYSGRTSSGRVLNTTAKAGVPNNTSTVDLPSQKANFEATLCLNKGESNLNIEMKTTNGSKNAPTLSLSLGTKNGELPLKEHKVEKLPENKIKEAEKSEKEEKLSPTSTVTKTVEKETIKDPDSQKTKNVTIIEKEAHTDKATPNSTETNTVERKVMKGEDGKETGKETLSEKKTTTDVTPRNETISRTVEHKVVKGDDMEEEIEKSKEEAVIGEEETKAGLEPSINTTLKKTVTERRVIKEAGKEGGIPKTVVGIEKQTKTGTSETDIDTNSMIDVALLDGKAAPKEIIVTEKKVEKFPDNETKETTVEEKAEKLPSNDTVHKTTVEKKVVKEDNTGAEPKKEILIEKEIKEKGINKTEEAGLVTKKSGCPKGSKKNQKEEEKKVIKELKQQVGEVKEKLKEEEVKVEEVANKCA